MKVLLYVDAENVSKEGFLSEVYKLKQSLRRDEMLLGKFYGKQDEITGVMSLCYQEGLEYVETSSIVPSKKNITDMKIIVDCMVDALVTHKNDVSRIILLSSDCDFLPLVYKLLGSGVRVDMPLYDSSRAVCTVAGLENRLKELKYEPIVREDALYPQYNVVRNLVGDDYPDSVLDCYFERKRKKFIRELSAGGYSTCAEELLRVPITEFSFSTVCKCLNVHEVSEKTVQVLDLYTRKFFGKSFTSSNVVSKLEEVLNKM